MAEVCRKTGISEATYYLWKRQHSAVGVSELPELRQLREENGLAFRQSADHRLRRRAHGTCTASCGTCPHRTGRNRYRLIRDSSLSQRAAKLTECPDRNRDQEGGLEHAK